MKKIIGILIATLLVVTGVSAEIVEGNLYEVKGTGYYKQYELEHEHNFSGTMNIYYNSAKECFSTVDQMKNEISKSDQFFLDDEMTMDNDSWICDTFYNKMGYTNCVFFDSDGNLTACIFNEECTTVLHYKNLNPPKRINFNIGESFAA